jgi:predicted GNAT superfamily acetyltransferase
MTAYLPERMKHHKSHANGTQVRQHAAAQLIQEKHEKFVHKKAWQTRRQVIKSGDEILASAHHSKGIAITAVTKENQRYVKHCSHYQQHPGRQRLYFFSPVTKEKPGFHRIRHILFG